MTAPRPFHVAFLAFPGVTQLDLTAPQEVFARVPGIHTDLYWKSLGPIASASGLVLTPTRTFADEPQIDLLCVPGGPGQIELMTDTETLAWVRSAAARSRWVTSVCTGSLVLAAAGLPRGYRATTHWSAMEDLALLGAAIVDARVVTDRDRITGAGVTSGLDFALAVIAQLWGDERAQIAQLSLEYDPAPPFAAAGSPRTARPELVAKLTQALTPLAAKRRAATLAAVESLRVLSQRVARANAPGSRSGTGSVLTACAFLCRITRILCAYFFTDADRPPPRRAPHDDRAPAAAGARAQARRTRAPAETRRL